MHWNNLRRTIEAKAKYWRLTDAKTSYEGCREFGISVQWPLTQNPRGWRAHLCFVSLARAPCLGQVLTLTSVNASYANCLEFVILCSNPDSSTSPLCFSCPVSHADWFLLQVEEVASVVESKDDVGSVTLRNATVDDESMEKLAQALKNSASVKVSRFL